VPPVRAAPSCGCSDRSASPPWCVSCGETPRPGICASGGSPDRTDQLTAEPHVRRPALRVVRARVARPERGSRHKSRGVAPRDEPPYRPRNAGRHAPVGAVSIVPPTKPCLGDQIHPKGPVPPRTPELPSRTAHPRSDSPTAGTLPGHASSFLPPDEGCERHVREPSGGGRQSEAALIRSLSAAARRHGMRVSPPESTRRGRAGGPARRSFGHRSRRNAEMPA
jgi:hypothetical protein